MDKKKFILDTLLPYKNDPSTCGYENNSCKYLTSDGKKCAVGQHMVEGEHQLCYGGIFTLNQMYGLANILTEKANAIGLSVEEWMAIQNYHDGIATNNPIYDIVHILEDLTGLKFPELQI